MRPTICWAIFTSPSCCVLTTERPYSGPSTAAWPTSTLAAGVGDGAGGIG